MPESVERRLAKLEEKIALQEQRMQALLSRKGGYLNGLLRLSGGVYAAGDVFPNTDGRGLAARQINPVGLTSWTAHFRPGETTGPGNGSLANYAWQAAPLNGAPSNVSYSYANDYMRTTGNAGGNKHFLSKAIPNAAGNWQNQTLIARLQAGLTTNIGLRIDDGSNTNYAEFYLDGQTDGTYIVTFRYNDAAGSGTVVSGAVYPANLYTTIRLLCYWNGATYAAYGYLVDEAAGTININSVTRTLTGNWTSGPPIAGRAGVFVEDAGNNSSIDWFWNTFA